jgi:SAM-dependent methyltransferase
MGCASPFRIAITPAIVVVLTAPRPTSNTPSLPRAGAISIGGVTIGHYIMGKMRRFLRKSSVGSEPLAVTMSGVRLGERALQVGLDDANIAALIAAKTGITGQATLVVADESAAASARNAVAEAGGLGDVHVVSSLHPLPFADNAYDLAVIHSARGLLASLPREVRDRVLAECRRVLRSGGRLLALEAGSQTGLRGIFGGAAKPEPQYEAAGGTAAALEAAGFRPVRMLGDRQGYRFIEGLRA